MVNSSSLFKFTVVYCEVMKTILRFKTRINLGRFFNGKRYFHDVSQANVIESKVDRSSKEFQVIEKIGVVSKSRVSLIINFVEEA